MVGRVIFTLTTGNHLDFILLQAKGLEWDTVFVCRVNEGTIPTDARRSNNSRDGDPDESARKHYEVGTCVQCTLC
jgi:hypothetical protein